MAYTDRIGELHVDWGSMFSGKSEELIRKVRRAQIAGKKVQVFKPRIDNRYSDREIVTHYGNSIESEIVSNSGDLFMAVRNDTDVVAIDEGQFFDDELYHIALSLKRYQKVDVYIAGLDMWATGEPILLMAKLAAVANTTTKHRAVCVDTGDDAYVSYCLVEKEGDVLVGGSDKYVALSEEAFLKRRSEKQV